MKLSSQRFDPDVLRQVTTLVAIIGSIVVNTLSNFFPLNGVNIGELSNTVFIPVTVLPANYAFAIWGLIYLGLIALGLYQLQPSQRQNPRLQHSSYFLVIACLAQCAWIYIFLARLFPLSVVAMVAILLAIIATYQRLGIPQSRVSRQERWFVQIPISIYLAWISVATVINVAIALYSVNWDGWGIAPAVWTVILMAIATGLAVRFIQNEDRAYGWVIVWALVAIAIRQIGIPLIAVTGTVMAIGLILLITEGHFRLSRPHQ